MGAAIATLLSYLAMMLGIYYVSNKYYRIDYEYLKIGLIFLSLGLTTGLYYFLTDNFDIHWIFKILFPLLFIFLIYILKILNFSALNKILPFSKAK
ncbi:MAG: polysaccharide biosynthesis C-terminal domain-containing protein [Ignavibacteria bacterium]|nr:polysaccharide biosynthesis C-terminal domain-containing protein [Ignavibacteria bacterium]